MAIKTLLVAALAVVSCADASWLPWMPQLHTRDLKAGDVPNNDFNIHHFNSSTICLRLSTAISIQIGYKTTDDTNATLEVTVPHLQTTDVEGSCGPDAFLHVSWMPEVPEAVTEGTEDEPTSLRVEDTPWSELTTFADTDGNSLHFDFTQQDDSYFLKNIAGVINIVDVPENLPPDSILVELSVTDEALFEAPLGVVSMCYGTTVIEAQFTANVTDITSVNITMTDIQLLAYHEESYWPNQAYECGSSAAPKLDNTVAFALGAVGALLVNLLLW